MPKGKTFEYENEETGESTDVTIPQRWEICCECEGEGKHAHAIDGDGITGSEWNEWDDDERENYLEGRYDRTCEVCRGSGKMKVTDYDSLREMERKYPGICEQWENHCEAEYQYDREAEAERRYFGG